MACAVVAPGFRVARPGFGRIVVDPRGEHGAQNAAHHVVEASLRHLALLDRMCQRFGEEILRVELFARLLIEPGQRRPNGRMHGAPIRHHEARITPISFQDLPEQPIVLAGIMPVHLVVGAHDAVRPASLDGEFERQQIGFPHGRGIDAGVEHDAIGLLRIQREVFGGRDHVPILHACDRLSGHDAGQQRIFGKVLEISAVARVTNEIGGATEQNVESFCARFRPHGLALSAGKRRVPGGGKGQIRRHRGRRIALSDIAWVADPEFRVGFLQGWDAQARHAGDEPGRAHRRRGLRFAAPGSTKAAMHHRDLLIPRHGAEHQSGASFGREGSIVPGPCRNRGRTGRDPSRQQQQQNQTGQRKMRAAHECFR